MLVALAVMAAVPDAAAAHGPVAPVATSYLARVSSVPAGIEAKVIDGYVRMWLQVSPSLTVVVLDYRHAPYLRFSRSGVQVNLNSTMYYLNQTPVAETPPADLRPSTPPHWQAVSSRHDYEWHDGRLQALPRSCSRRARHARTDRNRPHPHQTAPHALRPLPLMGTAPVAQSASGHSQPHTTRA